MAEVLATINLLTEAQARELTGKTIGSWRKDFSSIYMEQSQLWAEAAASFDQLQRAARDDQQAAEGFARQAANARARAKNLELQSRYAKPSTGQVIWLSLPTFGIAVVAAVIVGGIAYWVINRNGKKKLMQGEMQDGKVLNMREAA